jgi:hypothetical protein
MALNNFPVAIGILTESTNHTYQVIDAGSGFCLSFALLGGKFTLLDGKRQGDRI